MGVESQIPTGVATGVSGSLFTKEVVTQIAAGGRFIPPPGTYYAYAVGADVRMQVQDSTGVWQNVLAAGTSPGDFATDGTNVGFLNNGVGIETLTTIKIG